MVVVADPDRPTGPGQRQGVYHRRSFGRTCPLSAEMDRDQGIEHLSSIGFPVRRRMQVETATATRGCEPVVRCQSPGAREGSSGTIARPRNIYTSEVSRPGIVFGIPLRCPRHNSCRPAYRKCTKPRHSRCVRGVPGDDSELSTGSVTTTGRRTGCAAMDAATCPAPLDSRRGGHTRAHWECLPWDSWRPLDSQCGGGRGPVEDATGVQ